MWSLGLEKKNEYCLPREILIRILIALQFAFEKFEKGFEIIIERNSKGTL